MGIMLQEFIGIIEEEKARVLKEFALTAKKQNELKKCMGEALKVYIMGISTDGNFVNTLLSAPQIDSEGIRDIVIQSSADYLQQLE